MGAQDRMNLCLFNPAIEDNLGSHSTNLGDLLIEKAVRRELAKFAGAARIISVSTHAYPGFKQLGQIVKARLRIVGGTNLLSSNMDSYNQWKINRAHAWLIRNAVLLGVGWWQYQDAPNRYTRKLLRRCLSRKGLHSVRDSYTVEKLRSIGISNVINTGCPTMWPLAGADPGEFPREKTDTALLLLTDYYSHPELDQRLVELVTRRYRTVWFWPQGSKDMDLIEPWRGRVKILEPKVEAFEQFIQGQDRFDYIGTRLHGGVMCLLARRRSLILEVDNRAREIAKDTGLPTCARDDFEFMTRWIAGPSETRIRIDTPAIERWHSQFKSRVGSPTQSPSTPGGGS